MAEFILTCDEPFSVKSNGDISCVGIVGQYEKPVSVADLSQVEIGQLSAAVVLLFTIAYVFRLVRKMLSMNAGRF